MGDTAIYNLLIIYGMFFLTDIVKLDPVIAGNITLIATLWNAVSVGLVGYVSDHLPLKGGKRLPYMKVSILPMAITLVMFFTVIGGGTFALAVYYTVIMALLMTFHSSFMVPYEALGADLTMDGESRMALRSYARFFMGIGNLVGVVFLLPAVEQCENAGLSQTRAWQVVIGAIAVIGMISQVTTCTIFRDAKSRGKKEIKEEKTLKLFHEYRDLLRLKPMLMLLSVTILVNVANIFCNSSIAYFMKYNGKFKSLRNGHNDSGGHSYDADTGRHIKTVRQEKGNDCLLHNDGSHVPVFRCCQHGIGSGIMYIHIHIHHSNIGILAAHIRYALRHKRV